jgi:Fic/DOC family protein
MVTALRWLDLDPATHAFEPRAAEAHVRAIVARVELTDAGRQRAEVELHRVLVATHGAWAAGWRWSPGNSGPVGGWCCAAHSVVPERNPDREATVVRVLGALANWRRLLEQLAGEFTRLQRSPLAHAAAQLLPIVVGATHVEEAWYHAFATILGWYAEPRARDIVRVREEIEGIVSGRFESWAEPTDEVAAATCRELAGVLDREPVRDMLAAWLAVRGDAFRERLETSEREPVTSDGHERYVAEVDRARDPGRADRMLLALEMCRASARSGLALSLGQLAEWQALVLGHSQPVELRTGDAFAKGGRERYPLRGDLRELCEDLLAQAADTSVHPATRAARAYLDVCFLHPFRDGNARAARLALDHILTGAGLALRSAGPVFRLSRGANDGPGAAAFARVVDRLSGMRAASSSAGDEGPLTNR